MCRPILVLSMCEEEVKISDLSIAHKQLILLEISATKKRLMLHPGFNGKEINEVLALIKNVCHVRGAVP